MVFEKVPKSRRVIYQLIERIKNELMEKNEIEIKIRDIVIEFDVSTSTAYNILLRLQRYLYQTLGNTIRVIDVTGGLVIQKIKTNENLKSELDKEKEKIEEYKKALGL
ncbi:MAG: hypothetical protein LM587_02605 [Candidatus Aenigmarchaeota archaeon]|nr:hypothetical protein [Candidatus Aenigmarchaeota archaeon]